MRRVGRQRYHYPGGVAPVLTNGMNRHLFGHKLPQVQAFGTLGPRQQCVSGTVCPTGPRGPTQMGVHGCGLGCRQFLHRCSGKDQVGQLSEGENVSHTPGAGCPCLESAARHVSSRYTADAVFRTWKLGARHISTRYTANAVFRTWKLGVRCVSSRYTANAVFRTWKLGVRRVST